jgi:hypothetical protein
MHQVNIKKNKAAALRFVAYTITLVLSVLTTALLLYIALGYRFDSTSGHIVRSGLLLTDNAPEAGGVYINNQMKDNANPGRFVLTAGTYNLKFARDGYRDWSKDVSVAASGVREVGYPVLIPNKLTPKALAELEVPQLISQSPDKKMLLTHSAGLQDLSLITLKPESVTRTKLTLPASIPRESGSVGSFNVIEWSLNNKFVLLQQNLPSGAVQIISLNIAKPAESVNISSLYVSDGIKDVHYVGGDTENIYALSGNVLKRYSLTSSKSETLLANIRSYQPYSDDTILFDRSTTTKITELGIWKDSVTTVVHTNTEEVSPSLLRLAEFDEHVYFAVAPLGGGTVTIYRDPLKKPILAKQLPFTTLKLPDVQRLEFGDSAQFLVAQNGKSFTAYDFDDTKTYAFTPDYNLDPAAKFSWADSHHLQVKRDDGMIMLMDYDGTNQQALVTSNVGDKLYFAGNFENTYRFNVESDVTKLQVVPLVAE